MVSRTSPSTKIIWLILDSGKVGGIECHVVKLAKYLQAQHYQVCVVFLNDYRQQSIPQQLTKHKIPLLFSTGGIHAFARLIRQHQPDVLHAHGYKPGIYSKLLGRFFNKTVICTHHPGERGHGRIYCYNWLDEITASLAHSSIAVNKTIAQRLWTRKRKLIANFVDVAHDKPLNGQTLHNRIAFVGRFHHEKGPDVFCQLSDHLPQSIQLTAYGDGELFESLKQQYQTKVEFNGNVNDIPSAFKRIDLLCITSRSEGLPLIALEAMSFGVPVIAFAVGGLYDLIESGKNGWLISPGYLQGFSQAILSYLKLAPNQRQNIQLAAQTTIRKHYATQVLAPQIEHLYRS